MISKAEQSILGGITKILLVFYTYDVRLMCEPTDRFGIYIRFLCF